VPRPTVIFVIIWEAARTSLRALGRCRSHRWAGPFGRIEFVIVDVETTGWSPDEASITEIGAVRVRGGRVRARFSSLVNPGSMIPESVTALTGISDAMVAAAPSLAVVLPNFLSFAGGCVLTAHNAPFDVGFLTAACDSCELPWPAFQVLDTLELAHRVLGEDEVPDCRLATLAAFFGARTSPRHRALPDALATADVLTALLRRLAGAGARTLSEAGVTQPWADVRCGQGSGIAGQGLGIAGQGSGIAGQAASGTLPPMGHERARRQMWSPPLC
jgi:DNA polymerase-3 subunit epsilon